MRAIDDGPRDIVVLGLDGSVLQRRFVGSEPRAVLTRPGDGRLFVALGGDDRVVGRDPDSLAELERWDAPRRPEGERGIGPPMRKLRRA